ncbi:hypothetical protein [Kitasatospora sp. HPMI-4]|uniref:hypothetical protein n=1 Tax=Kitasatospora sp. HPMI-4 TaxID=3448443 RepID=UPI003F51D210
MIAPIASSGDGPWLISIENTLLLEVVEVAVVGSDSLTTAIEHFPPVGHILAVDVPGDEILPIGEYFLAVRIERRLSVQG